jgi:four helix bundle protein
MKITRFEDLECWQEARKLVRMVYEAVKTSLSFQKDFRLVSQFTAAAVSAVSVMNNVSEGWASLSNAEFMRFLRYSRRSCAEIQNCCYVALDQNYIDETGFEAIYNQAKKEIQIIDGLLRYLRSHRTERSQRS